MDLKTEGEELKHEAYLSEESDLDENTEIEFLDSNYIEPQKYLETVEIESIKQAFDDLKLTNLTCLVS